MRAIVLTVLAGCGFHVTIGSDGPLVDDALQIDTNADGDVDPPIDSAIDAMWTVADCPTNYAAVGNEGTRYRLHINAATLYPHHMQCVTEGTHLAVIDTPQEATALRQLVDGTLGLPAVGPYTLVYIGAAQRPNQSTSGAGWISATGTFTAFWEPGEPQDNGGGENGEEQFAAIWRDHDLLADVPSNVALSALCECDGKPITDEYRLLVEAVQ